MSSHALLQTVEEVVRKCRDMEGSLNDKLQLVADTVRANSPPFAEAVDRVVARLAKSGAGANAPAVGDPMPPFLLPDDTGRLVSLEELIESGPVALVFNRGHWCPYCRTNTAALAQVYGQVSAEGGQIVGITPDRQKYTAMLKSAVDAPFPILTDMDNAYAMSLNLVIWVGAEMQEFQERAGVDLRASQGNDAWLIPIPATFVVGSDGVVKARYVDPDYRKRMAMEDLVQAIRNAR